MSETGSGDLFARDTPRGAARAQVGAPLAERMRPTNLDEVRGQVDVVGPGGLIRGLIEQGMASSMILWGPAGVGKTTLARLLAHETGSRLVELSATSAGVKNVREAAADAAAMLRSNGSRTVLFVDEIHRFNKSQQDTLLPWVEDGSIHLLGATTENPSFEVVSPLLSRCRVVRLERLQDAEIESLLLRALSTPLPRGLGDAATLADGVAEQIAVTADGDARVALNGLELAVRLAVQRDPTAPVVTADDARLALQRPYLRHGKEEHFNLVSALQKSIRSSDPDAGLYWMTRMLEAGEDPKYVGRRLIRIASEDIGLADPRALEISLAGWNAVQAIGMPEGALALAQVVIYLAVAPKSDAVYRAHAAALAAVEQRGGLEVPAQLRNATTSLMREQGYGAGYQHAHDNEAGVPVMECLPEALAGSRFYAPTTRGIEARIRDRLLELRRLRSAPAVSSEPPSE